MTLHGLAQMKAVFSAALPALQSLAHMATMLGGGLATLLALAQMEAVFVSELPALRGFAHAMAGLFGVIHSQVTSCARDEVVIWPYNIHPPLLAFDEILDFAFLKDFERERTFTIFIPCAL
jgi:hypothetical protein